MRHHLLGLFVPALLLAGCGETHGVCVQPSEAFQTTVCDGPSTQEHCTGYAEGEFHEYLSPPAQHESAVDWAGPVRETCASLGYRYRLCRELIGCGGRIRCGCH